MTLLHVSFNELFWNIPTQFYDDNVMTYDDIDIRRYVEWLEKVNSSSETTRYRWRHYLSHNPMIDLASIEWRNLNSDIEEKIPRGL